MIHEDTITWASRELRFTRQHETSLRTKRRYFAPVREPLKTWRFRGALNRRRDAINHAGFFSDLSRLKDSRCFLLSARAERAYNKGALRSLPLPFFLACYRRQISTFWERQRASLSPSNFTLSLAPRTQMRVVFIFPSRPSLFYSQFSSLPPRHPSSPRPTLVRSEPLRLHAGQKRTLVQRVTNTRFFSLFFSERKYPLFGMERAHAFPGNSGKGGRREKEGETQYKKTR